MAILRIKVTMAKSNDLGSLVPHDACASLSCVRRTKESFCLPTYRYSLIELDHQNWADNYGPSSPPLPSERGESPPFSPPREAAFSLFCSSRWRPLGRHSVS